ncbi:TetR/AcrR family transcriptional regulator [Sphingorhabdus sp.]|uniref:TetR/AcrR family transcriptional regulator n=1 Tax=Sphingorhabdus sp. TaxID=1902408 RepID=UPI0032B75CFE
MIGCPKARLSAHAIPLVEIEQDAGNEACGPRLHFRSDRYINRRSGCSQYYLSIDTKLSGLSLKPVAKRVGRPRSFDRVAALEAAMVLFWRHGFEGVSIGDLTKAMSINSPSLYAAFGSKNALYDEALSHYLFLLNEELGNAFSQGLPVAVAMQMTLTSLAVALTREDMPPGCMIGAGSLRCGPNGRDAAERTANLRKAMQAQLVTSLGNAKALGELSDDTDVPSLAAYFATVVEGLSIQAQDGAGRAELLSVCAIAMRAWPI